MDEHGSAVAPSGTSSERYSALKRKSLQKAALEKARSVNENAGAASRGTHVCMDDEECFSSGDVAGPTQSPRSEGSGESMEVAAGRAPPLKKCSASSSLSSMDTLELAQLYLERTRNGANGAGTDDIHQAIDLSAVRTLGDGAEACQYSNGISDLPGVDLDTIQEQLRQRDQTLELAARVGQELLERNAALESDLQSQSSSRDHLQKETAELQHEIAVKERLLKMYYAELEDEDERAVAIQQHREQQLALQPPVRPSLSRSSLSSPGRYCLSPTRSLSSMSNLSEEASLLLQAECEELRSANKLLGEEASLLHQQAALLDQREHELVTECVRRLNDATESLHEMQSAHQRRDTVAAQHSEEIAELTTTIDRMRDAYGELNREKQVLQSDLESMTRQQSSLGGQVVTLQEQYMECLSLFREAQSELALYRKHATLPSHLLTPTQPAMPRQQSIGSELSEAMQQQQQDVTRSSSPPLPEPDPVTRPTSATPLLPTTAPHPASARSALPSMPSAPHTTPNVSSRGMSLAGSTVTSSPAGSIARTATVQPPADSSSHTTPMKSTAPVSTSSVLPSDAPLTPKMQPSPLMGARTNHANQIMSAVRSLDHKPQSRSPRVFQRSQAASSASPSVSSGGGSPALSAASSRRQSLADTSLVGGLKSSSSANEMRAYAAPEKLRIVKPMEGSLTLLKWKLLALQENTGADVLQRALSIPGIHQKGTDSAGSTTASGEVTPTGDYTKERAPRASTANGLVFSTHSSPEQTMEPSRIHTGRSVRAHRPQVASQVPGQADSVALGADAKRALFSVGDETDAVKPSTATAAAKSSGSQAVTSDWSGSTAATPRTTAHTGQPASLAQSSSLRQSTVQRRHAGFGGIGLPTPGTASPRITSRFNRLSGLGGLSSLAGYSAGPGAAANPGTPISAGSGVGMSGGSSSTIDDDVDGAEIE